MLGCCSIVKKYFYKIFDCYIFFQVLYGKFFFWVFVIRLIWVDILNVLILNSRVKLLVGDKFDIKDLGILGYWNCVVYILNEI